MPRLWIALLLGLCLAQAATAHPMDEWFVNLRVQEGKSISGVFRVPADQVAELAKTPVVFLADGRELPVNWQEQGLDSDSRMKMGIAGEATEAFQQLSVRVPAGLLDENQSLVGFLQVNDREPTTMLVPRDGEGVFPVQSEEPPVSLGTFFKLGLSHIIEGYDHLLFLFCLLIAGGSFRHFLVVVTAFTLGHSVTLGASVLGYISLPSSLTETIIAFSIVLAALMNLRWLKSDPDEAATLTSMKSRGLLAAGFGLIHGLGFAGILKEIGVEGSGAAAPLIGFNLGVEAGQLIIVSLFFPILMVINKWSQSIPFLKGCSIVAALVGAYWMVERLLYNCRALIGL